MTRQIFFMRHAAPHNPEGVLYGCMPGFYLSEEGRDQARVAGKFMLQHPIDLIIASPLERALQTAEIISSLLPNRPLVVTDIDLRDCWFGAWQGKVKLADWYANRADYWAKQLKGENGTELPTDTQKRMVASFTKWTEEYPDKNLLFISHKDPLIFLVEGLAGKVPTRSFSTPLKKANIWEINLEPELLVNLMFDQ